MNGRWLWVPLAVFVLVAGVAALRLAWPEDRTVRSALIGRPLPRIDLPAAVPGKPGVTTSGDQGIPRLVNVFASWCVPCIAEAPQLLRLKAMGVRIDGIAVRDAPADVQAFLRRNGDPYVAIGDDRASRVQLSLGSSGVPESFVVDGRGRIVRQHVGDIRGDEVTAIAAAVRAAR